MTDKSFGDHPNRNIVKNPLLSSAVTGLSIEDLTLNAVLLPVSLTQEVITRPDQQSRPQTGALGNTEHAVTNYPSGDANSNKFPLHVSSSTPSNPINLFKTIQPEEKPGIPKATVSKASTKSDDDFDVNEYFARLHGTRYVSAPLNSALKDDQNANLEDAEENLEEINLNEPDKLVDNVQQSLTADIAQNFSQLPTVLPQVASAVFSSFSNMLQTRKSREPTPEVSSGYQEVQFERPSEQSPVSMMLPPREPLTLPPTGGSANYRLPTKKKYAQIPGLASRDTAQIPYQPLGQNLPPCSQNAPQYFVPSIPSSHHSENSNIGQRPNPNDLHKTEIEAYSQVDLSKNNEQTQIDTQNVIAQRLPERATSVQNYNVDLFATQNIQPSQPQLYTQENINASKIPEKKTPVQSYSIDLFATQNVQPSQPQHYTQENIHAAKTPERKTPVQNYKADLFAEQNVELPQPQFYTPDNINAPVMIPPPPTFSDMPRKDSQTGVGRSILPPSVARRIAANQPMMKQSRVPSFADNILVPTPIASENTNLTSDLNQSANTPFDPQVVSMSSCLPSTLETNVSGGLASIPPPRKATSVSSDPAFYSMPHVANPSASMFPPSLRTQTANTKGAFPVDQSQSMSPSVPPSIFTPTNVSNNPLSKNMELPTANAFSSMQSISDIKSSITTPIAPPPMFLSSNVNNLIRPSIFTPSSLPVSSNTQASSLSMATPSVPEGSLRPPSSFLNPATTSAEIKEFPPITTRTEPDFEPAMKPSKPVPEPPKAQGNISYRMAKKRPQYYSGPIEGVGAISNFVKPVMPSLNTSLSTTLTSTSSFQGALFIPQGDTVNQAQNMGQNVESAPFDINRPAEITHPTIIPQPQEYITAFDMSRPTTENSERKEESSAYGLLGSLKSKLSALDINKIQSSVTTFFDPAYNANKKEISNVQENVPYGQPEQYGQAHSNFELFVPNIEQTPAYSQSYLYQMQFQNQFNYGQQQQHQQSHDMHNYYQNQGDHGQHHQNQGMTAANYFGNTSQNYQTPIGGNSEADAQTSALESKNIQPKKHPAFSQSDPEIQQCYSAVLHYQSQTSQPSQFASSQAEKNLQEAYSNKYSNISAQMHNEANISNSSLSEIQEITTETSTSNFFGNSAHSRTLSDSNESAYNITLSAEPSKCFFDSPLPGKRTGLASPKEISQSISQLAIQPPTSSIDSKTITGIASKQKNSKNEIRDANILQTLTKSIDEVTQSHTPVTSQIMLEHSKSNFNDTTSFFDNLLASEAPTQKQDFESLKTKSTTAQQLKIENKPVARIESNIQDVMFKITNNPTDFFGSFKQAEVRDSSFSELSIDCKPKVAREEPDEVITDFSKDTPPSNLSSAPLLGLSNMLADKTKELDDLQTEIIDLEIHQSPDNNDLFNKNDNPSYLKRFENEMESKDDVPDLNICETCREVNMPEDKEDDMIIEDLTTHLIENITSPIQLENPVDVPLTESNSPVDERADFESNQCEEISHITEETIETIQVQSATELLEDDLNTRDYGWSTDEIPLAPKVIEDKAYALPLLQSETISFEVPIINPDTIGFFGNSSLFENITTNIGAGLQAEFKSHDSPTILSRQMSIPSAPPEEEDSKSESIDVHSIEQDAKKDFPFFEEYVIEPSTDADVDKLEHIEKKNSSDNVQKESFTSRVDKYKVKDEIETPEHNSPLMNLVSTTSPSISIASYFDTGNYAVDTHYKNSLTSPKTNITFGFPSQMRVPPGFEEEFRRRSSTQDGFRDKNDIPYIPDTSTQTRPIYSPTFSVAQNVTCTATTVTSTIVTTAQSRREESMKLSDVLPSEILATLSLQDPDFEISDKETPIDPSLEITQVNFPDFSSIFSAKEDPVPLMISDKSKTDDQPRKSPLPDPINFFGSSSDHVQKPVANEEGFSRLASYFASPAKTEHTKSFFELSQSQNHYRQEPTKIITNLNSDTVSDSYKGSSHSDVLNITPDQYRANLNLMHDLTSKQNAVFKPEEVVKTVNYFTIEYDNENMIDKLLKGVDGKKENVIEDTFANLNRSEIITDDNTLLKTLNKCQYCCNLSVGYVINVKNINHEFLTDIKVKKCMDGNTEAKKETNMEDKKENENQTVALDLETLATRDEFNENVATMTENRTTSEYSPVKHHWFYRVDLEGKSTWRGFSIIDSKALEDAFNSPDLSEDTVVPTDGGRYDVNIQGRLRVAIYWSDKPTNVRRCSWFYKGTTDARYVPYTEDVAMKLEEEYKHGVTTGEWHRRLVLPNNELVVMHGPAVMVHFVQSNPADTFSTPPLTDYPNLSQLFTFGKCVYRNPPKLKVSSDQPVKIDHLVMLVHGAGEYRHQKERIQSTMRPRVVRRGADESEIEDFEPSNIDHLLLLCHGVGSACDMRFRNVEEVVDDFRTTSLQLLQSHYKNSYDSGVVGRVEVLPISWHATLHSGEMGVDRRLARITLDSIPRLRNFTNDTVLDVLFYTSPVFCQTIINTVCAELNRIYKLFCTRNPNFTGGVSLGGHSLGSVILYDLLCHQDSEVPPELLKSTEKCYVTGAAGTGQPAVRYPHLDFKPDALYALGSPIAIFECIRGVDFLGKDFVLPTCKNFFNIFHPYDPIAYRIEPLINPQLRECKPYLIPHHKGRKRMHLELKDTMARVGADIKQKVMESIKNTWSSMWKTQPPPDTQLEKVVEEEMEKEQLVEEGKEDQTNDEMSPDMLGNLNAGRRIDYVLQEAPFEMINEYLFAMSSHVCYWESEDTMLLMLREIYDALGVQPDCSVPQQSLTVQRARPLKADEVIQVNTTDHPSTSRGSTT